MSFKLENRYMIIKRADAKKYLSSEEIEELSFIEANICAARMLDERPPLDALVIEKDWPEYETALKLLSDRVDGTENDLCNELIRIAGALGLDPEFFDTESSQQHCMLEMARAAADRLEQAQ